MEDKNCLENDKLQENEIVIEDLNDFLLHISEMRKSIKNEEGQSVDAQKFFFRGQSNIMWDIVPGIFRENYSSMEAGLISDAYLRNPKEFGSLNTDFEKLAKLQHYGLPTRLLDVTSNPMVALYFACQPHQEFDEESSTLYNTDGIVLYQRAYCLGYNELPVSVISHLANMEISGDTTLDKLLEELEEKGIYSPKAARDCREGKYKSLIEILQNNYFVLSNMNNERLIRQSGLFLLVGKYNIIIQEKNVGQSVIQVAQSSAKSDFNQSVFRIPSERKADILEELDFYNINEGSLFPELEHQMMYIKQFQSNRLFVDTSAFTRLDLSPIDKFNNGYLSKELTEQEMNSIIDEALKAVNPIMFDECKIAVQDNLTVDWYLRGTAQSKIKIALTEVLCKYKMDRIDAKRISTSMVNKMVEDIKSA